MSKKKKGVDIPPNVAEQIVKDGEAQLKALKPIKDALDELPPNHSKEDAFAAFLSGWGILFNQPKKP